VKTIFLTLSLLIASVSVSTAQDTVAIVKATPVKTATESNWQTARDACHKLIADSVYTDSVFGGFMLMIGPRLWEELQTVPEIARMKLGNLMLNVPVYRNGNANGTEIAYSKFTQGKPQYTELWKSMYSAIDLHNGKLVDLNDRDKYFCWQYFAKVEEPIIAIETGTGRYILQFSSGHLLFIESTGY